MMQSQPRPQDRLRLRESELPVDALARTAVVHVDDQVRFVLSGLIGQQAEAVGSIVRDLSAPRLLARR